MEGFNPLKSGQLFQIAVNVQASATTLVFQSPKIGSVVSNPNERVGISSMLRVSIP